MAWQAKFIAQRGKHELRDVAVTAGDAEAQSDTIRINMDVTNMSKGEAIIQLEKMVAKIHAGPWPPLS